MPWCKGALRSAPRSYIGAIGAWPSTTGATPPTYTPEEVQAYLLHMVKERKLSYSSMNQAACAAQFLFQTVLGHGRDSFIFPWPKSRQSSRNYWPAKRSHACLRFACTHPADACCCKPSTPRACASSEACACGQRHRQPPDRMCVRVACGKGGKGRYTILSPTLLGLLRINMRAPLPQDVAVYRLYWAQPMYIDMAQRAYNGRRSACGHHQEWGHSHSAPLTSPPTCWRAA
jgi:integrase/recombinase XerD